jgi:hypothetical protein
MRTAFIAREHGTFPNVSFQEIAGKRALKSSLHPTLTLQSLYRIVTWADEAQRAI